MTMVECPVCHLRFHTQTEVEWHARAEHRRHHHRDVQEAGQAPAEHRPQPQQPAHDQTAHDDPDPQRVESPPVPAAT